MEYRWRILHHCGRSGLFRQTGIYIHMEWRRNAERGIAPIRGKIRIPWLCQYFNCLNETIFSVQGHRGECLPLLRYQSQVRRNKRHAHIHANTYTPPTATSIDTPSPRSTEDIKFGDGALIPGLSTPVVALLMLVTAILLKKREWNVSLQKVG